MLSYPPQEHHTDSKTIFFIGSAEKSCKINGKALKIYPNGNFCSIQKLKLGENKFKVEIDSVMEERIVVAERAECSKPVHYAKHYDAFPPEKANKENILRSIIVSSDCIKIPLCLAPCYNLERHGSYKYVLDLNEIEMDLDWVHYEDKDTPIIIGEVIDAKFPMIFRQPVKKIEEKWEDDYLILDVHYRINDFKVCIDPGHGGSQIGSISPKGIHEKDLNLSLAKLLKQELDELGVDSVMTREDDSKISLEKRVEICNESKSQLLISLHHNALPDGRDPEKERGISCHYFHEQSKPFATYLLDKLVNFTELDSHGFYKQNLHVLRESTDCAAVLVEYGFLIHPEESEIISSEEFQSICARVTAKAIYNYYAKL